MQLEEHLLDLFYGQFTCKPQAYATVLVHIAGLVILEDALDAVDGIVEERELDVLIVLESHGWDCLLVRD